MEYKYSGAVCKVLLHKHKNWFTFPHGIHVHGLNRTYSSLKQCELVKRPTYTPLSGPGFSYHSKWWMSVYHHFTY